MPKYLKDFYGWAQEQVALLRNGEFDQLDIPNLIKEIEILGRIEEDEIESQLTLLLVHLLKWKYQLEKKYEKWELKIKKQRKEYACILKNNPGLKPHLESILSNAYYLARIKAAKQTQLDINTFEKTCPWGLNDIMNNNFYPD